jgi:type II secretory pathway pseudopilin PulG
MEPARATAVARERPASRRPRPVVVRRGAGFSLFDLLATMAVIGIVAALGVPELFRATEQTRLGLGAGEIASSLRIARIYALRHSANVAIKFRTSSDGAVTYALFRDADGDGVRTQDVESGVDPQVEPWRPLTRLGNGIGFGFPPGPLPRDPTSGKAIGGSLDDPIRFNSSDLASFTAGGTATPGSVYLTDGRRGLVIVRVTNLSGRVRAWRWDHDDGVWRVI